MNAIAFFLVLLCYGYSLILMMEWLIHALPGSFLNPIRRFFFYLGFPLLKIGRGWFSLQWHGFDSRGLGLAFALWMIGRFGVPWLVIWGFTLKG